MKRISQLAVGVFLIFCLMLAFAPGAAASGTFLTTDGVNLRSGPALESSIIRTLNPNTRVEVLEHDPAGWSRVRVHGDVGFIRSDFLAISSGSGATFRTTDGVNLRASASTDGRVLSIVNPNTTVTMLSHDPAGWSRVRVNGTEGFIRSDFLSTSPIGTTVTGSGSAAAADSSPASAGSSSASQPVATLYANGNVNMRSGPSTDHSIIRLLSHGTRVDVYEQNTNGWSKVKQNGTDGYIRSDLLSAVIVSSVESVDMSVIRTLTRNGNTIRVLDLRTGISYNLKIQSVNKHLDVETSTRADTDALLRTYNGTWSWSARPVWVTIGSRTFAGAMTGMPHASSTIPDNGMNGQVCLHFKNTETNNKSYQADIRAAYAQAANW